MLVPIVDLLKVLAYSGVCLPSLLHVYRITNITITLLWARLARACVYKTLQRHPPQLVTFQATCVALNNSVTQCITTPVTIHRIQHSGNLLYLLYVLMCLCEMEYGLDDEVELS